MESSVRVHSFVLLFAALACGLFFFLMSGLPVVSADEVEQLKSQISQYNAKIAALEKEIAQYEAQLNEIGADKQTLEKTIRELDLSRRKLLSSIQVTQNRIYSTTLQIQELGEEIVDKQARIENDTQAVAAALRRINEFESRSMIEVILAHNDLNEFFTELETLQRFQLVVHEELKKVTELKAELETTKVSSEKKKAELTNYNTELSGQKVVLESTLSEKSVALSETAKKESEYQRLLNEKIEAREQFEKEILELESALRIAIDPNSIPPIGAGVLRWPFSDSYMQTCASFQKALGNPHCLTQYFGKTPFATQNPQVYNGNGHNGVDFRATVGTKIQAALSGTVAGVGNTDLQKGCYSYGKWVLIKHNNGLSTLYAHLSHISVSEGQSVSTGDVIGFSGNTGYSTGPHLHFTVYASQGVEVVRLGDVKAITNCSNVHIPIAPLDAYLNPLSYL